MIGTEVVNYDEELLVNYIYEGCLEEYEDVADIFVMKDELKGEIIA